jgi:hypothetical protein
MTDQSILFESPFTYMLNSTLDAVPVPPNSTPEDVKTQQQAVALALGALDPRDAVETLSAARAIAAHHAAMECYRRAAKPDVSDKMLATLLARAASLSRLTAQTIQAIERRKAAARGLKARAAATKQAAGGQDPMSSETMSRQTRQTTPTGADPRHHGQHDPRSTPPGPRSCVGPADGARDPMSSGNRPAGPAPAMPAAPPRGGEARPPAGCASQELPATHHPL